MKSRLIVFYDQQSTQNDKVHFVSMNEAFWTRRLCECWHREYRRQIVSVWWFLVVKRFLNRFWKWLKVIKCKLVLTTWCLIRDFNCVTHGIQHTNRKRKQKQFWIILLRSLELLKAGKRVRKLFQYNCLQWVLTV